ncbi:MAG: D-glycero-beta-D-manno-heptose-7-phosphate kinase [Candidatus Omnitrophica bacterium]|nr:D-glycero-beta-D-manno-heptose-7-phosphate kinase [Candidatus Omnitrophota bacterium]MDD5436098.1 D-glycero-beta-D-manno-heptose-7-phosphate kinase [Candidatus Omnitrophota bacterium]
MHTIGFEKIQKKIGNFKNARVLVIGDLILDEFLWGDVSRISPEAPVPVVWVKKESFMPGGASNVANNLRSLGANVYLAGVIGDDERGAILKGELEQKGIHTAGVITDDSRPTILKTRVVAQHQQVVRIDKERVEPLSGGILGKLVEYVEGAMKDVDAVIIEDYGKGVITSALLSKVVPAAKKHSKIISVDPKEENFKYYKGISVITPNNYEASKAVGFEIKDEATLLKAGQTLLTKLNCKIALITLGEHGMAVFQKSKPVKHIPTVAQEVFDVSGAGDTVIATYTLSLAAGADPIMSAHIANCAAGIVVGKVGIAVVTPNELLDRIKRELDK